MKWAVRYRRSVEKDIRRLPHDIRLKALACLRLFEADQLPQSEKIKGTNHRYRIKFAADYRVVYSTDDKAKCCNIEFVGHRKDAYRWFQ